MRKRFIPFGLLFLLVLVSLACNTLNEAANEADVAKDTVVAVVTEARVVITEGAPLLETAKALGTQVPDIQATVAAIITENPQVVETAKAVATQGLDMGEAPEDIPVVDEATVTNFYGSEALVSYTTSLDFASVVAFYKEKMPALGWEANATKSFELKSITALTWTLVDRQAMVIITVNPVDGSSLVAITISPR